MASTKDIREQNLRSIDSAHESAEGMGSAVSQAAEAAQDTMRAFFRTAWQDLERARDQFARSLGFSTRDRQELERQSASTLKAVNDCSTILLRGVQEISREWITMAQQRFQKNLERAQAFSTCNTAQELFAAQAELVRANMQEMIENSRKIAETSATVADDAAQALKGKKNTSPRLRRAA